ncbi:MAG TPA: tetratricopeptide repeat protein [Blastocatellia bacterium]|nr:tetratricopeptide repeat protein [Blastocatellia bacterium]
MQHNEDLTRAQREVVTNPHSAEAFFRLGEAYRNAESHNPERAGEAYQRAILLKPAYPDAYKGMAWVYRTLKQYAKEVEALEQAIRLNPNDAEAYCQLGDAHSTFDAGRKVPPFLSSEELEKVVESHRKKAEVAVQAYTQAIAIKPDYAGAYRGLGDAYLSLRRHRESTEAYERAIRYAPQDPLMRIGLGYTYLDLSDYKSALAQHKAAVQLIENVKEPHRRVYEIAAALLLDRIQERRNDKQHQ